MDTSRPFSIDLNEHFRHLKNAPIVEAIVDWRARATQVIDAELLQEQLKSRLPKYPKTKLQHEVEFAAMLSPDGASSQHRRAFRGCRIETEDSLQIAQFNRDGLTFSRLAPYENWDALSTEALRMWSVFNDLSQPSLIHRLGLRFINRIALDSKQDVAEILAQPPKCLTSLGVPLGKFLFTYIHDVPGHPYKISVTQTIQEPTPEKVASFGLILDIDVYTDVEFENSTAQIQERLDEMRYLKNKAFFTLLTPRSLESFQ